MKVWDDNEIPLAFLITFRTCGSWLHGDDRTSIDRHNNKFRAPRIPANKAWNEYNEKIMTTEAVILNPKRRKAVDDAIREVCEHRKWRLQTINIRTNHGHIVVSIGDCQPEKALNAFKAYATRKMKERGLWTSDRSPWADKGSERWLWNEQDVRNANDYVANGQGCDLRDFDSWKAKK